MITRPTRRSFLTMAAASATATMFASQLRTALAASGEIDRLGDTRPLDPEVFAAVAVMLVATAALACAVPAWRASRLDPMRVLRME